MLAERQVPASSPGRADHGAGNGKLSWPLLIVPIWGDAGGPGAITGAPYMFIQCEGTTGIHPCWRLTLVSTGAACQLYAYKATFH